MGSVWAIVVAGGAGHRFGSVKQYATLRGERLIDHAVASGAAACDGVILVVPAADVDEVAASMRGSATHVIAGGVLRSDSVRCGLAALPDDAEIVAVHDAARPLAPPSLFAAVIASVREGADAAVPGSAPHDTVKRVANGLVLDTLERQELVLVQTPQAFRVDALRAAHEGAPDATDDAALVERTGGKVVVVPGDPRAAKVTTPDDLAAMERWAP